jgi:hypothetical protein
LAKLKIVKVDNTTTKLSATTTAQYGIDLREKYQEKMRDIVLFITVELYCAWLYY